MTRILKEIYKKKKLYKNQTLIKVKFRLECPLYDLSDNQKDDKKIKIINYNKLLNKNVR